MEKKIKIFFLFSMIGLVVYSNSLNNRFQMDDYFLLDHPDLIQTKFIFSQWDPHIIKYFHGYYRPMAHMVYAFCYGTFKSNYWQYHLFNLFLLVALSFLIFVLIDMILQDYFVALLAGVYFLIHPVNGIMVNNIVTSALTLQVIFILGSILLFWRYLEQRNSVLYFLSLTIAFLALFWYDIGILTPIYLGALIVVSGRDTLLRKSMLIAPFFLISFAYLLFRHYLLNGTTYLSGIAHYHMTAGQYLATLSGLVMWYVSRLFSLHGIVMQWAMPVTVYHLWANACILILLLAGLFAVFFLTKKNVIRVAAAWSLIGIAPIFLIAFENPEAGGLIEPHWFVFVSLSFCIVVAYLTSVLINRAKAVGIVFLVLIVFAWSASSRAYNQLWADEKTYAHYWSEQVPHFSRPLMALGDAYLREGDFKRYSEYYTLALKDGYSNPESWANMGIVDFNQGRLKQAEGDFRVALIIDPHFELAYNYLGVVYLREGDWEKAKIYFSKMLRYDPFLLQARRGLATVFLARNQLQQAVSLCLKNLEIKSDDPDTLMLLIEIYTRQKDLLSVKKYAYQMIHGTKDPDVLTRLGAFMTLNGLYDIALGCYTKTLKLVPHYKNAYLDEGSMFLKMGKYDLAIRIWQEGLRLYPTDQRFQNYIGKAVSLKLK